MKEGISRRDFLGLTAMAAGAAVTAEVATLFSKPETVSAQVSDWPQTPEAAANRWKGLAAKWKLTERQLRNPAIGVDSFTMQEWRYTEKTPPFPWPTTPEEAAKAFGLPIVGGLEADKFMPAWKEEDSGRVTGWHYKEDGHGECQAETGDGFDEGEGGVLGEIRDDPDGQPEGTQAQEQPGHPHRLDAE